MVGREVNLRAEKSDRKSGAPILQIEDLRVVDEMAMKPDEKRFAA